MDKFFHRRDAEAAEKSYSSKSGTNSLIPFVSARVLKLSNSPSYRELTQIQPLRLCGEKGLNGYRNSKLISSFGRLRMSRDMVTAGVTLRRFRESDLPIVIEWLDQRDVWKATVIGDYREIAATDRKVRQWFAEKMINNRCSFLVERASDAKPLGTASFRKIENKEAQFDIAIGETQEWGRGYGRAALLALLRLGFIEMRLDKVVGEVFGTNVRALAFYKTLGFTISELATTCHSNDVASHLLVVSMDRMKYEKDVLRISCALRCDRRPAASTADTFQSPPCRRAGKTPRRTRGTE